MRCAVAAYFVAALSSLSLALFMCLFLRITLFAALVCALAPDARAEGAASIASSDALLRTASAVLAGEAGEHLAYRADGAQRTGKTPVYIVLSGGVSLGAYEGGYASTIVRYLKRFPEHFELRGVSGTSAGAINAVATALEYCRIDNPTGERRSVNHDTWAPVSWSMLYDEDQVSRNALLNHAGLRAHGREILDPERYPVRSDCDVVIASAVTQSHADVSTRELEMIAQLVEYLGVRMRADRRQRIVYEALAPDTTQTPARLALTTADDGTVPLDEVLSMLLASSAFPAAFPPVEMTLCAAIDAGGSCTDEVERTYIDGGVFNNVPVDALLPFIAAESTPPLVILVDLDNHAIPRPSANGNSPGMGRLAQSWLAFARARDYAAAWRTLQERSVDAYRANQRYPAASEAVSAFAGFLDRSFREVDHALGVHDALRDLPEILRIPPTAIPDVAIHRHDRCIHDVLQRAEISEACEAIVPLSEWVTLRALVAAAESRCANLEHTSLSCQALETSKLRERLPLPSITEAQQRQRSRLAGTAPTDDFQAFLVELRMGDFEPEINADWMSRRGANRHRPEVIWSRHLEDALQKYSALQQRPTLPVQIAMDTLLANSIPVLPRPSLTALANLNNAEVTANLPLSTRIHLNLGGTLEWGVRGDRAERWHLASGGPVARLGWLFTERQSLFALFADAHAGILFGPVLDNIAEAGRRSPESRAGTRPNAAIFLGIAPKAVLFRRLTADIPIRVYWLCETPVCTELDNPRPSFSVSFRIGWTWTFSPSAP